jgi:hypothetical protein
VTLPYGPGVFGTRGWPSAVTQFSATATNVPGGSRIAVVIDHDLPDAGGQSPAGKLTAALNLLSPAIPVPPLSSPGGLHSFSTTRGVLLGAWFMPDNATNGAAIERFLLDPNNPPNLVAAHAVSAFQHARTLGADAQHPYEEKAIVRSYLAWHQKPDEDYGEAVSKGRFSPPTPLVARFVQWFDAMFP